MARTISMLCSLGDMTIGWDANNDSLVLPVIQKMLDNKIRFFILKKKVAKPVEKITQVSDVRKIVIPDDGLQSLFASGLLALSSLLTVATTGEIATTAEEVAENDTVAVKPVAGG